MPKRKTSHDYCRVRFGIFKRRRVGLSSTGSNNVSSSSDCNANVNDEDCCEVRVRRHKNNELLYHQNNLTGSMTSVSTCHHSPRSPVYFPHLSVGSPSLKCLWSSDCSDSTGNVFQPSKLLPTIVDTCNSLLSHNSTNCSDTNNSTTRMLQLQPVQSHSKLSTDSDDRFQKVMNLVALTSSLKLSEENTKNHSFYRSSDMSNGDSQKDQMELTQLKPSVADTTCSSVMSNLASNFWSESSASSNSCFGFTVDFKTKGASYAPHSMSHLHSQTHSVHSSSPSPRLNRPSPDDSSDSDEGFCEPLSKRVSQFAPDSITQPDKELNLFEANGTHPNRSKFTNHLLNSSSSCNLYWQMMSNLYGIPTKISCPTEDSCPSSTPRVEIKLAQPSTSKRCITRWTQKPFVIKLHEDKLVARKSQAESPSQQESVGQIFAVGKLAPDLTKVEGTLDLALQHVINSNKSVFVFDCEIGENAVQNGTCEWYRYCHEKSRFLPCHCIPVLKQNFAGICANELPQAGRTAIKALFQRTLGTP